MCLRFGSDPRRDFLSAEAPKPARKGDSRTTDKKADQLVVTGRRYCSYVATVASSTVKK
jgi:hypothetical protein